MAHFDDYLMSINKEPNAYQGDPPSTEEEYNALTWPEGVTPPTWAEVVAGVAATKVKETRKEAYMGGQPIGDFSLQLEKLWDDIDAGKLGSDAKTGDFYNFIKDIKTANPK